MPMNPFLRIVAGVVLASTFAPARAQNWPQFRGPGGTGVGAGKPPRTWDVTSGQNVKWKVRIPGLGHSSPIAWGGRVFVTTAVQKDHESPSLQTGWLGGTGESPRDDESEWTWKVVCLDLASGKTLWEQDACRGYPKAARHIKSSHANCTPATDGKHVVAFFASEGLYCYDTDGKLLWKKDLGMIESGPHDAPELRWGFASSPIIFRDRLILQCDAVDGAWWASFDLDSGQELRRVMRKESSTWCTPAVCAAGGRPQVICNGWKEVGGYDLESGEPLWTLHGGGDVPVPTPQVAGDLILITSGHGRSPIYAVRAAARGDLTPPRYADDVPKGLAWWRPKNGSYMPTPLVLGDRLYVCDDRGVVGAYEVQSGKEIFRERIEGGGTFSASAVAADGRIYFVNEEGDVFVIAAGGKFELLGRNLMHEVCMATPAIVDGKLLIRGRDHLWCIGE